jgi:hypothetical protein
VARVLKNQKDKAKSAVKAPLSPGGARGVGGEWGKHTTTKKEALYAIPISAKAIFHS